MGQWTHVDESEKVATKEVYYEGTDQLKAGYLLCYDRDQGTAADSDLARAWRVEKPAAGNLHWFAGVVAAEFSGFTGPGKIKIYQPTHAPYLVNLWSEDNCSLETTDLSVQVGSYIAGGAGDGPIIARAMQTLDRSDTNGMVLCEFYGLSDEVQRRKDGTMVTATKSRTAVQLPTEAIWANFPIEELRQDPWKGSLVDTDFTGGLGTGVGVLTFKSSGATMVTGSGALAIGELICTEATANEGWGIGWNAPIVVSGGHKWAFEIRFHVDQIANDDGSLFIGLAKFSDTLGVNSILTADEPPVVVDEAAVGFNIKETDGNVLDFVYNEASQTQAEHDADYITVVGSAYRTLGMYFNGTTIQAYADGVLTGTAITAVEIAAATFPTGEILRPCIGYISDDGGGFVTTVDWIRCAQVGAL